MRVYRFLLSDLGGGKLAGLRLAFLTGFQRRLAGLRIKSLLFVEGLIDFLFFCGDLRGDDIRGRSADQLSRGLRLEPADLRLDAEDFVADVLRLRLQQICLCGRFRPTAELTADPGNPNSVKGANQLFVGFVRCLGLRLLLFQCSF